MTKYSTQAPAATTHLRELRVCVGHFTKMRGAGRKGYDGMRTYTDALTPLLRDTWTAQRSLFELAPEAGAVRPSRGLCDRGQRGGTTPAGVPPEDVQHLVPSRLLGDGIARLIVFTQAVLEKGHGWTDGLECRGPMDASTASSAMPRVSVQAMTS